VGCCAPAGPGSCGATPGTPGQKPRQWRLGTRWESRALASALCRSVLLTWARVSSAETWKWPGGGDVGAFLGVKGSPVQIRPSRRRSKAGSGFQPPALDCNGSARALPSGASTKRSGVSCRQGTLTSDYRQSARPRAGSHPLRRPGELSSRSRGRQFISGHQRLVLGNNSRRRAAPASACHFVPPGSSPPYVERTAFGRSLPLPVGSPPICQLVATHLTAAVSRWLNRCNRH
jgi:hypothetical protein